MSSAPDFDPNSYMRESTYRQQLMQDEHALPSIGPCLVNILRQYL